MPPASLAAALAAASLSTVSGKIYLREGGGRFALPGAVVLVRPAGGGAPVRAVTSDAQGRYVLADPPPGRFSLSVSRPGYYTRAVASGEPVLVVDTRAAANIENADFELAPGGVITGRITDPWGEPREGVSVNLFRVSGSGQTEPAPRAATRSDDRGIYRLFGLEAGRYVVLARPAERLLDEPAALYFPGTSDPSRAREIPVRAGEETQGIDIVLRPEPAFQIAGRIAEAGESSRLFVQAAAAPAAVQQPPRTAPAAPDGAFSLAGLPAGRYAVTAWARPGGGGPQQPVARQVVDLDRDLLDLVLRPVRTASVEGRLALLASASGRPRPSAVRLRFRERNGGPPLVVAAHPPDFRFAIADVWPGAYRVEIAAPAGVYLRRLLLGAERAAVSEVAVMEGASVTLEVEAGLDPGSITGLVKAPDTRRPQPHAQVVLARAEGAPAAAIRVQADQTGRFVIAGVPPGEYRLGAWIPAGPDRPRDSLNWESAGAAVKRLSVEPNVEIDLELTAAP